MAKGKAGNAGSQLSLEIIAEPTKEFFISMLTKDIALIPAIVDLIDNSVDGALRLRGKKPFKELSVSIEFSLKKFTISDNCGGITVDVARNYAFCFGRPEGMPQTNNSLGQFGVGMKRALFKLGKVFTVESTTESSYFKIHQNVDDWKKTKEWKFHFDQLKEDQTYPVTKQGTSVMVEDLHSGIQADFALENFSSRLIDEISARHAESMARGLEIKVGGKALQSHKATALESKDITHAARAPKFDEKSKTPVNVRLFAGIDDSEPGDAGWYVYCNGRLILRADQALTTGWGEGKGKTIPKYHNQYARFRGYAHFDCEDAARLPWNTTKTSIDADHPIWRNTRAQMIEVMRPVIDFLNKLKEERDSGQETTPLNDTVEAAASAPVDDVKTAEVFKIATPKKPAKKQEQVIHILYKKPTAEVDRVKEKLGVDSAKEVGEKTFEYFFKYECK
jgi:hypothetical protein